MNTIYNIIWQLNNTTSSNEKIDILKANKDNGLFKSLLLWCYDPSINFYISKVETDDFIIGEKTIDSDWPLIKYLFETLSSRTLTGNAARDEIKNILSQFDKNTQNIILSVFKHDLRCGIGIGLITKAYNKNFLDKFSVQLANKYSLKTNYKNNFWWITPKLDGIRCFWSSNTPDILWSRSGKEIIGFEHIVDEIKKLYNKYPDILFLDGELFTEDIDFNSIQSLVTSTVNFDNKDKTSMNYNIFAIGSNSWSKTEDMQNFIKVLYDRYEKSTHLRFITAEKIDNNYDLICQKTKDFVCDGYEGCVLRNPDTYYEYKRSNNLVKFKFFKESDLNIVDMVEGTGKYVNKLGSIICEGIIDGKNISTECGTGFSDKLRQEFWENKQYIIGKTAEIKYQEISSNALGNYSLRFPVFRKLKLDR